MKQPLVSIITPCYNGEDFVKHYFDSILAQTWQNLELIFVNDGSTDATEQIALSYRKALEDRGIVYKYLSQPNGGQAKAVNAGLQVMTGKYLIWPDSDDRLSPGSVEMRALFLEEHPEFAMVRSNCTAFDYDTGKYLFHFAYDHDKLHKDIFLDLINEHTYCCGGFYMIRVDALREIYPDLRIMESRQGQNWQILIPMAGRHLCGYIEADLYHYAVRQNSHSHEKKPVEQEIARQMGLKAILEDGIRRSGRTDRDYEKLVEAKYAQAQMRIYLERNLPEAAKEHYRYLCREKAAQPQDHKLFLSKTSPIKYWLYNIHNFFHQWINRIARILRK